MQNIDYSFYSWQIKYDGKFLKEKSSEDLLFRDFFCNYLGENFLAKNIIVHFISIKSNIIENLLERYPLKIFFRFSSGFI